MTSPLLLHGCSCMVLTLTIPAAAAMLMSCRSTHPTGMLAHGIQHQRPVVGSVTDITVHVQGIRLA